MVKPDGTIARPFASIWEALNAGDGVRFVDAPRAYPHSIAWRSTPMIIRVEGEHAAPRRQRIADIDD